MKEIERVQLEFLKFLAFEADSIYLELGTDVV